MKFIIITKTDREEKAENNTAKKLANRRTLFKFLSLRVKKTRKEKEDIIDASNKVKKLKKEVSNRTRITANKNKNIM